MPDTPTAEEINVHFSAMDDSVNLINRTVADDTEALETLTAEEVKDMVDNITENGWKNLSNNGRGWYDTNCSRKGSFDITQRILEGFMHE